MSNKKCEEKRVSSLELYYITRAYERGEMNFKEWRRQAKEWALAILQQAEKKQAA